MSIATCFRKYKKTAPPEDVILLDEILEGRKLNELSNSEAKEVIDEIQQSILEDYADLQKAVKSKGSSLPEVVKVEKKDNDVTISKKESKFETGKQTTINYLHNKDSATDMFGIPNEGSDYGRGYEPSGKYVIETPEVQNPDYGNFESGELSFENPLVVDNDSLNWKKTLSNKYNGKTGKELSKALIKDGYDAVITLDESGNSSEILDLTSFDESKAMFSLKKDTTRNGSDYFNAAIQNYIKAFENKDNIAEHNAKVEIYESLVESGIMSADILMELRTQPEYITFEKLEQIGDNRTWDEIVEEHIDDTDAETVELPKDIWEIAKLSKGVTDNLNETGYVLPDGTWLDFSGKKEGGTANERAEDHRQLGFDLTGESGTDDMIAFQKLGAVRIDSRAGSVDMESMPNGKQLEDIEYIIERAGGGQVDLADGNRRASFEVEKTTKLKGVIRRFYNGEDIDIDTLFKKTKSKKKKLPLSNEKLSAVINRVAPNYLDSKTGQPIPSKLVVGSFASFPQEIHDQAKKQGAAESNNKEYINHLKGLFGVGKSVTSKMKSQGLNINVKPVRDTLKRKPILNHLNSIADVKSGFQPSGDTSNTIKSLPSSSEGRRKSILSDIKILSNILRSNTFLEHGYGGLDIKTQRVVMSGMNRLIKNDEVFNSVVKFVPVDVMNLLASKEFSANMGLHDSSVNQLSNSVSLSPKIPSIVDAADALITGVTFSGAEVVGIPSDFITASLNSSTAKGASSISNHGVDYIRQWRKSKGIVSNLLETASDNKNNIRADGSSVFAVFHNGIVYLNKDNMTSERIIEEALFHEGTHGGLKAAFKDKTVRKAMHELYVAMGRTKGLRELSKQLDVNLNLYSRNSGSMTYDEKVAMLTEELLAHVGEKGSAGVKLKVRELIGKIREWFIKLGWKSLGNKVTASDIAYLAKVSRELGLQKSEGVTTRFMQSNNKSDAPITHKNGKMIQSGMDKDFLYHGSPSKFDSVSMDNYGEGEGGQGFGYGFHTSSSNDTASNYATKNPLIKIDGAEYYGNTVENAIAQEILDNGWVTTKKEQKKIVDKYPDSDFPKKRLELIEKLKNAKIDDLRTDGVIYKVAISKEDRAAYMEWDLPLKSQSKEVINILKAASMYSDPNITAADLYYDVSQSEGGDFDGDKASSEFFDSIGIKGVKYLDQLQIGINEASEQKARSMGLYNYTTFNPSDLKIEQEQEQDTKGSNFKKWFGDSKVVDENGEPLVVYHGTNGDIAVFDINKTGSNTDSGMMGKGFYFASSPQEAGTYARGDNKNIMPVYLSMQNPFITDNYSNFPDISQPKTMDEMLNADKMYSKEMRDKLISQGYDGVIFTRKDGSKEYVAFNPNQIKSATGNNGDYSTDNDDIRFSLKKPTSFEIPTDDNWWDSFIHNFQDKFNSVSKLQKRLNVKNEGMDVQQSEILYHGKAKAKIDKFESNHVEPIQELVSKSGKTLREIGIFLHARHAEEANKVLKKRNPDRAANDALSGMTNIQASKILNLHKNNSVLQEIAVRIDKVNAEHMDRLVADGLATPDEVNSWKANYKHYVPLHREDVTDSGSMPSRGSGYNIKGKNTKLRVGSDKEVDHENLIAYLLTKNEADIVKGEKNKVGVALYNLAKENPNEDFWKLDEVRYTEKLNAAGEVTKVASNQETDNELRMKIDGKQHSVSFQDTKNNIYSKRIISSMKNLSAKDQAWHVKRLTDLNRWLSMINTSLSPEFVISNLFRDLQTAGYNLSSTEAEGLQWEILKDMGKSYKGIRVALYGKGENEWSKHFKDFENAGGRVGWMDHYADIDARRDKLEKEIKNYERSGKNPKILFQKLMSVIENENTAVENAVRLATFVHAKKLPNVSDNQAAVLAKELTVNFNKGGEYKATMNAFYLFYNASIQGTMVMAKAMTHKKVQILAASTIAFAASLDVLNRAIGGDDEDGQPFYDKIDDSIKDRNIILMIPFSGGEYSKLPLPYGYNVLHVFGQEIGAGLTRNDPDKGILHGMSRIANNMMTSFNPIAEGTLLQTAAPTAADFFVKWSQNIDWHGGKVMPEQSHHGRPIPEYQRTYDSTPRHYKAIAKFLSDVSGGDAIEGGKLDVSPEVIQMAVDMMTGSAGRVLTDISMTVPNKLAKGDLKVKDVPMLRKLYGQQTDFTRTNQYYDRAQSVLLIDDKRKYYRNDQKEMERVNTEGGKKVGLIAFTKSIEKKLKKLRKKKRIYQERGLDDKVELMKKRIYELQTKFNTRYNETLIN